MENNQRPLRGDEIQNWYRKIPKYMITKYHNPNLSKHGIKIPFRACCIGGSGSGKTTLLLEFLSRANDTFDLLILCVKNIDEPLYRYLLSRIPENRVHIYEQGQVPDINEYKNLPRDFQILAVFDDLVNDKKSQEPIKEFFLRGRKIAGGISNFYLSQSYFAVPKFIRINCNYIILKKLSSTRDLNLILSDYNLGLNREGLLDIYCQAVERNGSLLIDIDAQPAERFRRNFLSLCVVKPVVKDF